MEKAIGAVSQVMSVSEQYSAVSAASAEVELKTEATRTAAQAKRRRRMVRLLSANPALAQRTSRYFGPPDT